MKKGIVSYDIAVTRYRTELSKLLKLYGERVQLSVFEFEVSNDEYNEMISKVKNFYKNYINYCMSKSINDSKRSIRIYSLCENCSKRLITMDDYKNRKGDEIIII